MRVADIAGGAGYRAYGNWDPTASAIATDIQFDSRKITPGAIFLGMTEDRTRLAEHVRQAVTAGAALIVTEHEFDLEAGGAAGLVVPDIRVAAAAISCAFFDYPTRELSVVAVTGTNGKSSVTYLLAEILGALGIKAGTVGTLGLTFDRAPIEGARTTPTTPEAVDLQRLFRTFRDLGGTHAIIEASSQALAQRRVDGSQIEVGVFTNLTQDHLDFHGSMDAYREAKLRLFEMARLVVAGADDPVGRDIHRRWGGITFGRNSPADLVARDVTQTPTGSAFTLCTGSGATYPASVNGLGEFTVLNALAAIGACQQLGIEIGDAVKVLADASTAPGRMQIVRADRPYTVMVDYAHSPDSLEQVLDSVRRSTPGRIITVFGCGGDRDRTKRAPMGQIVSSRSDVAVLTSDNPRSEDPLTIMADVAKGVRTAGTDTFVQIADRREAIRYALTSARAGDLVLIAGKGDEPYQIIGDRTLPFSDAGVVTEILAESNR